ncbi:serine/threonine protein kinase [Archangium violaceum]|nr:serine/threonine protein kinase [Archangium violaceum]
MRRMEPPRPLTLHPEALPAGTMVDHWRVVERLGLGGYGAVYRVEAESRPGVFLALKLALQPGDARAEREVVLLMEKAVHPHVVRFHGCARWPDPVKGHTYHVMDLVPGLPLDAWAETRNPSFLQLAAVGARLALTLGELHRRGVFHRDVKPENLLIHEPDGEPVLVDFGVGDYVGAVPLTPTPLPPGTPHLRSPEAMRFWLERDKNSTETYEVGAADDLYALAVSLYRAVTGHYPFPPERLEDMLGFAIAVQRAPAPRDFNRRMPKALSDVLSRMLAKKPEERYRNGTELHDALMAAAAFGGRAQWEASLFEWEESPAAREGEEPGRRIRRPANPTKRVTLPAPLVRLTAGASSLRKRRRERAEVPVSGERPRRRLGELGWVLGAGLGLGLAVLAVYGLDVGRAEKPTAPVGHEMAQAPDFPETGLAASPLLPESTPAAVAPSATSSEDETSVKTKQQKTPAPQKNSQQGATGNNTLRKLCVGAAVATQVACAGAQVAKGPKPEECPLGSMEAMTQTLDDLFSPATNPFHWEGPGIRLDNGDGRWVPAREGDTSIILSDYWGKLPANTVLTGKLYFGEGRVFGRFTRAWTPQGTSFPICAELWDEDQKRGLEMKPGSTRDNVQVFSTASHVRAVRHFD